MPGGQNGDQIHSPQPSNFHFCHSGDGKHLGLGAGTACNQGSVRTKLWLSTPSTLITTDMTPASKSAVPGTIAPSGDRSVIDLILNENGADAFVAKIQAKPAFPIIAPPGPRPSRTGGRWNGRTRRRWRSTSSATGGHHGRRRRISTTIVIARAPPPLVTMPNADHCRRQRRRGGRQPQPRLPPRKKKVRRRRKKRGGSLSPNVYTFGAILACAARDGDVNVDALGNGHLVIFL
jgi:hypothetical protein